MAVGQTRRETTIQDQDALVDRYGLPLAPAHWPGFATWLLRQTWRDNWIGDLARHARADPGFPKGGTYAQVRAHLLAARADGDMYQACGHALRLFACID